MSLAISTRVRGGRRILATTIVLVAFSGVAAQAASVSTTGSTAWNSGGTLTVKDTKAEGDAAYANWNRTGANRVTTNGGNGSTASVHVNPLQNFRACRDQGSWNPDNCTSWVTP